MFAHMCTCVHVYSMWVGLWAEAVRHRARVPTARLRDSTRGRNVDNSQLPLGRRLVEQRWPEWLSQKFVYSRTPVCMCVHVCVRVCVCPGSERGGGAAQPGMLTSALRRDGWERWDQTCAAPCDRGREGDVCDEKCSCSPVRVG